MTTTQPRWLADWESNELARMLTALMAVGARDRWMAVWDNGSEEFKSEFLRQKPDIRAAILHCLFGDVFAGEEKCPTCRGKKRVIVSDSFSNRTGDKRRNHWGKCRRCHGTGFTPAPMVIDPRWRSSDVMALAKAVRGHWIEDRPGGDRVHVFTDETHFERMPILHDALLDAGCDNEAMLAHCREPGPHVGGCWVVRMLLERGT